MVLERYLNSFTTLLVRSASPAEIMIPPIKPKKGNPPVNMCRKKLMLNQKAIPETVSAFLFIGSWNANLRNNMAICRTPKMKQNCIAAV